MSDSTFPVMQEAAGLLARAAALLATLAAKRFSATPPATTVAPAANPPAATPDTPVFLTTKQAAALLGVSVKGLEAMRARGAGPPHVRIGNRVRYRAADLPGAK